MRYKNGGVLLKPTKLYGFICRYTAACGISDEVEKVNVGGEHSNQNTSSAASSRYGYHSHGHLTQFKR